MNDVCVWWVNRTFDFGAGGDAYTYYVSPTVTNTRSYSGVVTLEQIIVDIESDINGTRTVESFYNDVFMILDGALALGNIDFSISALGEKVADNLGFKDNYIIAYGSKATKWGDARLIFGVGNLLSNDNLIGNTRAVRDIEMEEGATNKNGDVFKSNGLLNKVEYNLVIEHLTFREALMAVKFLRTLKSGEIVKLTPEWKVYFEDLFLSDEAQLLENIPLLESSDSGFNKHKVSFRRVEKVDI